MSWNTSNARGSNKARQAFELLIKGAGTGNKSSEATGLRDILGTRDLKRLSSVSRSVRGATKSEVNQRKALYDMRASELVKLSEIGSPAMRRAAKVVDERKLQEARELDSAFRKMVKYLVKRGELDVEEESTLKETLEEILEESLDVPLTQFVHYLNETESYLGTSWSDPVFLGAQFLENAHRDARNRTVRMAINRGDGGYTGLLYENPRYKRVTKGQARAMLEGIITEKDYNGERDGRTIVFDEFDRELFHKLVDENEDGELAYAYLLSMTANGHEQSWPYPRRQ